MKQSFRGLRSCRPGVGLLILSSVVGCAGKVPPAPVSGADPWTAVTDLDRGAALVVHVDPSATAAQPELFEPRGGPADAHRVEGALSEATRAGLLLRHEAVDAALVDIARADVVRVYAIEGESRWRHVLVGTAAGFGICALGGLLGEGDLVFTGRLFWAGACAVGGAGLGYLANRDPETLRLVYARGAESCRARVARDRCWRRLGSAATMCGPLVASGAFR